MDLLAPHATEPTPDADVAQFVPIPTVTRDARAIGGEEVDVEYRIQRLGEPALTVESDPMAEPPMRMGRTVVNAVATFVLIMVTGLMVTSVAPRAFGYGSVVVVSGSMEPAIRVADVVVTTPSDGEDLSTGAVIDFDHEDGSRLHRIAAVTDDGYRTSGDANRADDSELVRPDQVNGVGVVVVPFVGLPSIWIERGQWYYLVIAGVVMLACAYFARLSWAQPPNELLLR